MFRNLWRRGSRAPARKGLSNADLRETVALTNGLSQPNLNDLNQILATVSPLALNIKQMGYELARQLAAALPPPAETGPSAFVPPCKLSTQADIESDWVAHWCRALAIPVVFHRKIWELAYLLQALHAGGVMREGARGLGFGCGQEPIPSLLAARGVDITVTDLPPDEAAGRGWIETGQHAAHLDAAFHPHLVDRAAFDRHVSLRYVDMNAVPDDLAGFDFCWSVCALEHLGSIEQGLAFIERSVDTLRPGGIAVHTTEFNIRADGPTIDNWPTVLFQRHHLEELAARLAARGHEVAPFDFDLGAKPLDRFIDLPPFPHNLPAEFQTWLGSPMHLKVAVDGFVSTCVGLTIHRSTAG